MKASIVIPCYQRLDLLKRCLSYIEAFTAREDYAVVVVDNGGENGLAEFNGADHVLHLPGNLGFAAGCNLGAAVVDDAPVIVFLNDDTEVTPGWLPALVNPFTSEGIGIVGARLHRPDGSLQHAGIDFRVKEGEGLEAFEVREERPSGLVPCVTGACLAIRREAFNAVKGFDTGYWNGYDDVDLCLAVTHEPSHSWCCWYERSCQVMHHGGASGPERWSAVMPNVHRLQEKWGYLADHSDRTTAIVIPAMRPKLIAGLLENIRVTTPEPHKVIVVASDPEIIAVCDAADCATIRDQGGTWGQRLNLAYHLLPEPYIFCGADDLVFTPGWLSAAHAVMGDMEGVVSVNDTFTPEGTQCLVSTRYIHDYSGCIDMGGVIIHPGYRHQFSERELFEVARMRKRFAYAPESVVEHNHWLEGRSDYDEVYRMGEEAKWKDTNLFTKRRPMWSVPTSPWS